MKLKEGDLIAGMNILCNSKDTNDEYILVVTSKGYGKRVPTT